MMSTGHTKLSIVLWKVPENKIRTNEIQLVTDKSNLLVIFYISYLFPISDLKVQTEYKEYTQNGCE